MAEETPCPCKQKLTDGEKNAINIGLADVANIIKNPNGAALEAANRLFNSSDSSLSGLSALAGPQGSLANVFTAIQGACAAFANSKNVINAFGAECTKLTDPKNLLRTVSSLGLAFDLQCALGIPGLDISGGMGVFNQNGQFAMQVALNAHIQMDNVLKDYDLSKDIEKLNNGLLGAANAINNATTALNDVVQKTQQIQAEAFAFIQKYTSINGLMNLVNISSKDSCFKLGGAVNASLFSNDFYQAAGVALPGQGGISTR
jgi:hypothetical protein